MLNFLHFHFARFCILFTFKFCQVLQVPNLETGKFEPLISGDDNGALTKDEEMQFRNMVNSKRLRTIRNLEKIRCTDCTRSSSMQRSKM